MPAVDREQTGDAWALGPYKSVENEMSAVAKVQTERRNSKRGSSLPVPML